MSQKYTDYSQLPLSLSANEVALVLGLSRAKAYELMHSKGFPTLVIGKRLIVPKDKLLCWIDQQTAQE